MNRSFGNFLIHASLIVLTFFGLVIFLVLEVVSALPLPFKIYLWFGLVWTVLFLLRVRSNFSPPRMGLLAGMLGLLLVLYITPWSTRKPFLRQFNRIHEGMTRQEVAQVMAGYKPSRYGEKWVYQPRPSRRFDSDWGDIYFENGIVTKVFFSPD